MKLASPELRNRLAAEYVLGTMRGRARRRFQTYLLRNAELQAHVAFWETHFIPLADRLTGIEPPSRVWSSIESRLDAAASAPNRQPSSGLWQSLSFWRSLGLGAAGLAAVLTVAIINLKPIEPEPMLTAVLAEENNDARVFVEQPKSNVLMVKMVKPWRLNSGFAHELWVIPKDGTPRSLGLINAATDTQISLAGLDAKLINGAMLAVSLEPPGGSPTGSPTGRVVCKGTIAWMPPKPAKPRAQI